MRAITRFATALTAVLTLAAPAAAQQPASGPAASPETAVAANPPTDEEAAEAAKAAAKAAAKESWTKGRPIAMQYFRPQDKRGLNVFETTKEPGAEFSGFKLDVNAGFTSQVQSLKHRNTAVPNVANGIDANQLQDIGFGFNNSTANVSLNAQLAPGIRVALTSYLSSRHHNETWVKDGYIQIDE